MKLTISSKDLFELKPEKILGGKSKIENNEILVTGGAGFLGIHILKNLVQSKKYSKIYTIVRDKNKLYEQANYFNLNTDWLSQIFVIQGDLQVLDDNYFPDVEFIIHSAAKIHCIKTLKQLWNNNVEMTHKMNRIYQNNKLYYISTLSVFVSSNNVGNHIEESLRINNNYLLYGGYAQSKYIAEKITEDYSQKIIRLGLITGASDNGIFPKDFFVTFIKEIKKIGFFPEGYQEALVDMTPVDYASKSIVKYLSNEKSIFHIANREATRLSEFIDILNLKPIKKEDWLKKISNLESLNKLLLQFAFFKDENLKNNFNYFNFDLFQTTGHTYNIEDNFEINNKVLLNLYCSKIIKDNL